MMLLSASLKKIMPLILQILSQKRNHVHLLRKVEACMCITTWSSGTLSFHMPSSVRWTMAPSHICSLHLPLKIFFQLYQIGGFDYCQSCTVGQDHGASEGGGA